MSNGEKKFDWNLVIAIISLVLTFISTYYAYAEHQERKTAQSEAEASKSAAKEAEERYQRELRREKDRLRIFMNDYAGYIAELHNAISRYKETRKPEHEKQVRAAAAALVEFVKKWRVVHEALTPLLDGQVTALDLSLSNPTGISEEAFSVLERNSKTQLPLLEKAIEDASRKQN